VDFPAFSLTLRLAACTTAILLLLATPLAAWLASGHGWGRRAVQALVALPLVLPPTVLGFGLLWSLGPRTAFGRAITSLFGHPLAFSFAGLVAGSLLYSVPFAVQPLAAGFAAVDPQLRETAAVLGASDWQVFRRVMLPLARPSFLTAGVLTFAHTVGEFGVVLMVGGDIPGSTRTLSVSLYDLVQEMNYSAAARTSWLLIALSFLALLVVYAFGSRATRDSRSSPLG
jgi:molybdate transport system permease protein